MHHQSGGAFRRIQESTVFCGHVTATHTDQVYIIQLANAAVLKGIHIIPHDVFRPEMNIRGRTWPSRNTGHFSCKMYVFSPQKMKFIPAIDLEYVSGGVEWVPVISGIELHPVNYIAFSGSFDVLSVAVHGQGVDDDTVSDDISSLLHRSPRTCLEGLYTKAGALSTRSLHHTRVIDDPYVYPTIDSCLSPWWTESTSSHTSIKKNLFYDVRNYICSWSPNRLVSASAAARLNLKAESVKSGQVSHDVVEALRQCLQRCEAGEANAVLSEVVHPDTCLALCTAATDCLQKLEAEHTNEKQKISDYFQFLRLIMGSGHILEYFLDTGGMEMVVGQIHKLCKSERWSISAGLTRVLLENVCSNFNAALALCTETVVYPVKNGAENGQHRMTACGVLVDTLISMNAYRDTDMKQKPNLIAISEHLYTTICASSLAYSLHELSSTSDRITSKLLPRLVTHAENIGAFSPYEQFKNTDSDDIPLRIEVKTTLEVLCSSLKALSGYVTQLLASEFCRDEMIISFLMGTPITRNIVVSVHFVLVLHEVLFISDTTWDFGELYSSTKDAMIFINHLLLSVLNIENGIHVFVKDFASVDIVFQMLFSWLKFPPIVSVDHVATGGGSTCNCESILSDVCRDVITVLWGIGTAGATVAWVNRLRSSTSINDSSEVMCTLWRMVSDSGADLAGVALAFSSTQVVNALIAEVDSTESWQVDFVSKLFCRLLCSNSFFIRRNTVELMQLFLRKFSPCSPYAGNLKTSMNNSFTSQLKHQEEVLSTLRCIRGEISVSTLTSSFVAILNAGLCKERGYWPLKVNMLPALLETVARLCGGLSYEIYRDDCVSCAHNSGVLQYLKPMKISNGSVNGKVGGKLVIISSCVQLLCLILKEVKWEIETLMRRGCKAYSMHSISDMCIGTHALLSTLLSSGGAPVSRISHNVEMCMALCSSIFDCLIGWCESPAQDILPYITQLALVDQFTRGSCATLFCSMCEKLMILDCGLYSHNFVDVTPVFESSRETYEGKTREEKWGEIKVWLSSQDYTFSDFYILIKRLLISQSRKCFDIALRLYHLCCDVGKEVTVSFSKCVLSLIKSCTLLEQCESTSNSREEYCGDITLCRVLVFLRDSMGSSRITLALIVCGVVDVMVGILGKSQPEGLVIIALQCTEQILDCLLYCSRSDSSGNDFSDMHASEMTSILTYGAKVVSSLVPGLLIQYSSNPYVAGQLFAMSVRLPSIYYDTIVSELSSKRDELLMTISQQLWLHIENSSQLLLEAQNLCLQTSDVQADVICKCLCHRKLLGAAVCGLRSFVYVVLTLAESGTITFSLLSRLLRANTYGDPKKIMSRYLRSYLSSYKKFTDVVTSHSSEPLESDMVHTLVLGTLRHLIVLLERGVRIYSSNMTNSHSPLALTTESPSQCIPLGDSSFSHWFKSLCPHVRTRRVKISHMLLDWMINLAVTSCVGVDLMIPSDTKFSGVCPGLSAPPSPAVPPLPPGPPPTNLSGTKRAMSSSVSYGPGGELKAQKVCHDRFPSTYIAPPPLFRPPPSFPAPPATVPHTPNLKPLSNVPVPPPQPFKGVPNERRPTWK